MKTCSKCSQLKPIEDFSLHRNGRSYWCKPCVREYSRGHAKRPNVKAKRTWRNLMARCYKPADISYPNYGGRGISVCEAWHNREVFLDWYWETYIEGCVLDRINNDGNYEPGNCRWTTLNIQNKNKRVTERQLNHMRELGRRRAERFRAMRESKR